MSAFTHYRATHTLKSLAQHPFDLTQPGNLSPARIQNLTAESCGYKLLYGTERVTDEVMTALHAMALEARVHEKMEKMQAGEVINKIEGFPSENRPVLHTAMRDFFDHPNSAPAAREVAQAAQQEHNKLKAFLANNDKTGQFTQLISIGIGGSDLGPKALYLSLQHLQKPDRAVHFVSNVDPDDISSVLRQVDLKKTLVIVVSKSGTTLETLTNEEIARKHLIAAGLKPEKHIVAITSQGSPMDNKKRYLECFYMWDSIGGRYSCTSMVGAVALSFAFGHDVFFEILRGANAMDKAALTKEVKSNLPLMLALLSIWNRNFLNCSTCAIVPYSQALWRFSAHIQQVEMESNGKRIDQRGSPVDFATAPVIWGEAGTAAQHSFYQLIHQGTAVVPVEFIGFLESQYGEDLEVQGTTSQEKLLSNLIAQAIALATGQKNDNPNKVFPGNRPSLLLVAQKLTPYASGALFALYEHKVAFEGFIWGINSFDQEGVQLGKVLAEKVIKQFVAQHKGQSEKEIEQIFPLGAAFLKQLQDNPVHK
jgi:glucose-6-phosphate isomerase